VIISCNSFHKSLHIILIDNKSDSNVTHPDSTERALGRGRQTDLSSQEAIEV
jgi:hypothetical protein